jgi:hypothetical protein
LRLLSAQGINRGSGKLSFQVFEELYTGITKWQQYHDNQFVDASRIKNHNVSFLIVYAQDLVASFPTDRSTAANIASRAIATAKVLGHAV